MSKNSSIVDEPEWTRGDLQALCAALKTSIPENEKCSIYTKGLKAVDWNKVAFAPFSPEACLGKWTEILSRMRKMRTLAEIVDEAEDTLSNPVKNKSISKIYPDLPKRPSPPNAVFYEENRAKYHKKHPEMKSQKVLRALNKKFKNLSRQEKARYTEKYKLAAEEYWTKMQEFRQKNNLPPMPKRSCKRKRVLEDDTHDEEHIEGEHGIPPKPPVNGYNLFCKEQAASIEGDTGKNNVTVWAQRWRDLTEKQRGDYRERCSELRREFSVKLEDYLKGFDTEKQEQILEKHGIKRPKVSEAQTVKRRVKTFQGEPKMPSRSGNAIFTKKQMELLKNKSSSSKEVFSRVSQMWMDLPTKEKDRYKVKVDDNMRLYAKELQEWFKKLTPAEQQDYLLVNPSKHKYLDGVKTVPYRKDPSHRPSDSEDENIESSSSSSSSDEEEVIVLEGEELEEGDDNMFDLY
uniref:Nucleolar transcription factor 1-like n=1 Tax=Labrus bergylta TaxID=56723 RepID=A0A3Q3G2I3_9LABR|nr:nucleolar transcription factor 1-like [Labrus bergylta]